MSCAAGAGAGLEGGGVWEETDGGGGLPGCDATVGSGTGAGVAGIELGAAPLDVLGAGTPTAGWLVRSTLVGGVTADWAGAALGVKPDCTASSARDGEDDANVKATIAAISLQDRRTASQPSDRTPPRSVARLLETFESGAGAG